MNNSNLNNANSDRAEPTKPVKINREQSYYQAEKDILSFLAESKEVSWAVQMVLLKILEVTNFPAGAIRLIRGDDYSFRINDELKDAFLYNKINSFSDKGFYVKVMQTNRVCRCILEVRSALPGSGIHKSPLGSIYTGCLSETRHNSVYTGETEQDKAAYCCQCLTANQGLESMAIIPLISGKERIGILYLLSTVPDACTRDFVLSIENLVKPFGYTVKHLQERVAAEQKLILSNKRINALSVKLLQAYELERARVARELHDEVGQALTAVKIDLQLLNNKLTGDDNIIIKDKLEKSISLLNDTVINIRRQIVALRPPPLDEFGLTEILPDMTGDFQQRTGITTKLILKKDGFTNRLPEIVELALYRCLQEALTNITRHSMAGYVYISIQKTAADIIRLTIEDDGIGFNAQSIDKNSGQVGIKGMRERIQLLNGKIRITSSPGKGTKISITVPVKHKGGTQ